MMMDGRPHRSVLYMPASNARAIEKARALPCDAVIFDLEDAVAPEDKTAARKSALEAVAAGGFGQRKVVIRVNAIETPWGADDLRALGSSQADAVLIPKIASVAEFSEVRGLIGPGLPIWGMVETPRALLNLGQIAAAAGDLGVTALVAGTNDLAKELRCRSGNFRAPLLPFLSLIVAAARSAGIVALDGVSNKLDDDKAFTEECQQGLEWGFDGKTLIHPSQIASANRVFSPDPAEVEWARKIVAAFEEPENAGRAVIRLEGTMVELLHREEAERTLKIADQCGVLSS